MRFMRKTISIDRVRKAGNTAFLIGSFAPWDYEWRQSRDMGANVSDYNRLTGRTYFQYRSGS